MKKIFLTLIIMMAATMQSNATDYTGSVVIYGVNDEDVTQDNETIQVTKNLDGTYKLLIPNVVIKEYEVGDIVIDNMTATQNEDGSIDLVSEPKNNLNNIVANNCNLVTKLLVGKDSEGNYGIQTTVKGNIKDDKAIFDVGPYTKTVFGKSYTLSLHYEGSEGTQGIATITTDDTKADCNIYNIAGQRINMTNNGIVIKNGKKYLSR